MAGGAGKLEESGRSFFIGSVATSTEVLSESVSVIKLGRGP